MLDAWHVNIRHSKDVQKQLMRTFVSRLSISSCLWSNVERAEFSLEKVREWFSGRSFPWQLLGCCWADTYWFWFSPWWTFFLSPEFRRYVWFFLSVFLSKMWLLSKTGTAARLSCKFSDHMGCRHDQKIAENLALSGNPTWLQISDSWTPKQKISKLHLERNLANSTIRTRTRFRHLCAT